MRKPIVREGFNNSLPPIILELGNNLLIAIIRGLLSNISPIVVRNIEAFSKVLELTIGELELIVSKVSRKSILRYSI